LWQLVYVEVMLKNIERFRGIGIFGSSYQVMLENDSHAPGSVDCVLMQEMVKLCSETAAYLYSAHTPIEVLYERGTRPKLESYVKCLTAQAISDEEVVDKISWFTSKLYENAEQDLDKVRIGGLEEEIIERGSDWCTDLARVACALCQVAKLPSRLVGLADVEKAYSGHVIMEVYRDGVWGAVDPTTNVIYRHVAGKPATTWELMNNPQLVKRHWRDETTSYTNPEQFRAAGITNYFVWRWKQYDYTVSGVNNYYRSILEMSSKGWSGGQRWLHNEDRSNFDQPSIPPKSSPSRA